MRDYMPDLESRILHRQILSPLDLERIFDLPRGHPHHAEISADQIFFKRPAPHYADYRTPIQNLYQCGASTHPGGGVTGVPGHNAARVILGDRRRWA
jgi:phytoene dehydrogenase-like protein